MPQCNDTSVHAVRESGPCADSLSHGSFAIVDQTGKGKALQTLKEIESDHALQNIPYIYTDPELERQGHCTHLMSTAQLEVLYGRKDSPGEKTVIAGGPK